MTTMAATRYNSVRPLPRSRSDRPGAHQGVTFHGYNATDADGP